MKVSEAYPSTYLKASDLQNRNVPVVIDRCEYEKIGEDNKLVMYFKDKTKGMVLNKTNANTVSMLYGDDTDDWEGGDLILYSTRVDFQGKSVDAIRVRVPPRKPTRTAPPRETVTSGPQRSARDDDDRDDTRAGSTAAIIDDEVPF